MRLEWILSMVNIVITGAVSAIVSFLVYNHQLKKDIIKTRRDRIDDIKKEAILKALDFCDDYLSWCNYDSGIEPIRRQNVTSDSLTIQARECYNNLLLTCENQETIDCFVSVALNDDNSALSKYNKFRNCCRKEMGASKMDISNKRTFISIVSTQVLKKDI